MVRYNLNYLFCTFSLFLLIFSTGSNIETVELVNNGDFEGSAEKWREQMLSALKSGRNNGKDEKDRRIDRLEKELRHKDKALAETAALLVLKKKADAFWGVEEDEK